MASLLRHKLALAIVALVVAAAAGGAYAATNSATSPAASRQAFLRDVARRLHVTPQALDSALRGAFADRLSAAVAAGRLTRAQANRIEQAVKHGLPMPLAPLLRFGAFGGRLQGLPVPPAWARPGAPPPWALPGARPQTAVVPGGPGDPGFPVGPGGLLFGFFGIGLHGGINAAVGYLGISRPQLMADLRSGKTLAQIASSHGKSAAGLKAAIESTFKQRLDRLVSRKVLTSAQESRILSHMNTALGWVMNNRMPMAPAIMFKRWQALRRGALRHGAWRRGASLWVPAPPAPPPPPSGLPGG